MKRSDVEKKIDECIKNMKEIEQFLEKNKEIIVDALYGIVKIFELIEKIQQKEKGDK